MIKVQYNGFNLQDVEDLIGSDNVLGFYENTGQLLINYGESSIRLSIGDYVLSNGQVYAVLSSQLKEAI